MKNKEIPIFFTIDDGYAPFLSVALNSAIKNSSEDNTYRAIVLYENVTKENISKIEGLATDNFKIEFIPMKSGLESITDHMSNRLRCDYFTLTIYFRLFIAEMFPEYDKAIYIDSDVVVLDDLAKLYDTDIADNFIGACPDVSVLGVPQLCAYMEEVVGVNRHKYINSGVLLMNLKKLREVRFSEHFLALLNTYHFECIAPDQDYLNAICAGKIHYLDGAWDVMPDDSKEEVKDAKIVHYNLFSKPWCYDGIQYADYFWKYAKDSGFMQEISDYKAEYSDEKKEADAKCLELLINRGLEITKNDTTFKNMYESGVKVRL